MTNLKVTIADYHAIPQPTWCSGCGDFTIWSALKLAFAELQLPPHEVLLCFDIGCNGNMSDKIKGYRVHGLHGRVLPLALGAKIANPNLTVVALAGDGGTYSEGINHFIHALRSEIPVTFIVHDNGNYGLTKGQASSTTPQGVPMNSNPDGNPGKTLHPLSVGLSMEPSFMAQSSSVELQHMKAMIVAAIKHQREEKKFSFINILQSCPTYNKATTQEWYQEHTYIIPEGEHDPTDFTKTHHLIEGAKTGKVPLGILYKHPGSQSGFDHFPHRKDTMYSAPLTKEVKKYSSQSLQESFR